MCGFYEAQVTQDTAAVSATLNARARQQLEQGSGSSRYCQPILEELAAYGEDPGGKIIIGSVPNFYRVGSWDFESEDPAFLP